MPNTDKPDLPRTIGFFGAAAVMVGIIIGSGIFRTPAQIAALSGTPWLILLLWGVGGLLALLGALTYSELACMHPHSGGIYVFLREAYGRPMAFVFGWTYLLISKPLAAGGIVVVLSEHAFRLAGIDIDPSNPDWRCKAFTIAVLAGLTAINIAGVGLSTGVAKALTAVKFGALALIVLLALALWKGDAANFETRPDPRPWSLAIAPIMAMVLWTYDGWSDVGAVAGEVKDPQRTLPRAFLLGALSTTILYLAVNAVFIWMIPLATMRELPTVAPAAVEALIGPAAGVVVTALVVLSTLGSSHGSILTGARVSFAQARDGLLFEPLSRIHPRLGTPAVSLLVQLALSTVAVLFVGSFERLAGGFVFTMWIFYGLAGGAIFILRIRRPDAPRPFRCPGYPFTPAIFVLAALAMTALSIADTPGMSALWLAILLAGWPVYYVWKRARQRGSV